MEGKEGGIFTVRNSSQKIMHRAEDFVAALYDVSVSEGIPWSCGSMNIRGRSLMLEGLANSSRMCIVN